MEEAHHIHVLLTLPGHVLWLVVALPFDVELNGALNLSVPVFYFDAHTDLDESVPCYLLYDISVT